MGLRRQNAFLLLHPETERLGARQARTLQYPGDQRFLASGSRPIYPIGNRYVVKIVQAASPTSTTLSVFVDGVLLTTFTDQEGALFDGTRRILCRGRRSVFPFGRRDDFSRRRGCEIAMIAESVRPDQLPQSGARAGHACGQKEIPIVALRPPWRRLSPKGNK